MIGVAGGFCPGFCSVHRARISRAITNRLSVSSTYQQSQSFPRARPRPLKHKLASDIRRDASMIGFCVEFAYVTIGKERYENRYYQLLRHRTRILANETPCVALLRITMQLHDDCYSGKRFRFPFSNMSKRAMDKPPTPLSQYLHFSSHLRIEPLVSRLVVLCF